MGEAKRRKQLDPNFGKPMTGLKLLARSVEPTQAELEAIFAEFVPDKIARDAFVFSIKIDATGQVQPPWLQALVNDRKLSFDEAYPLWCGDVREWIDALIDKLTQENSSYGSLKEQFRIRLSKSINNAINPKLEEFWDLLDSEECENPPTIEGFWRGELEGNSVEEEELFETFGASDLDCEEDES